MRLGIACIVSMGFGLAGAWIAPPTLAQDLARRAVPQKWIQPLLPEDLPKMELPEYVSKEALEKARAESFGGRYKLSLLTLQQAKGADPVEVALIKVASLAPLGRRQEALEVTGAADVRDNPRIQIARARVLAELGQKQEASALVRADV